LARRSSASLLRLEGELRYHEFNDKKHKKVKVRLAEIHLGKIGKLDRAGKGDPNAALPDLPANGEEAPFALSCLLTGGQTLSRRTECQRCRRPKVCFN
jgi:hypothetical protein